MGLLAAKILGKGCFSPPSKEFRLQQHTTIKRVAIVVSPVVSC